MPTPIYRISQFYHCGGESFQRVFSAEQVENALKSLLHSDDQLIFRLCLCILSLFSHLLGKMRIGYGDEEIAVKISDVNK